MLLQIPTDGFGDNMSDVDKDTRNEDDAKNNDAAVTCDGFIIGWSSFMPMIDEDDIKSEFDWYWEV